MIRFDCPGDQQVRFMLVAVNQDGSPAPLEPGAFACVVTDGQGDFEYNPATNGLVFRLESNPVNDPLLMWPLTHFEVTVTLRIEGRALPPI